MNIKKNDLLLLLVFFLLFPIKSWAEKDYLLGETENKAQATIQPSESADDATPLSALPEAINGQVNPTVDTIPANSAIQSQQKAVETQPTAANLAYFELKRSLRFVFDKLKTPKGIIVFLILVIVSFFLAPVVSDYLAISTKAYKDYQLCRGTQHLKQIRSSLKVLEQKIKELTNQKNKVENEIKTCCAQKETDLGKALATYLVETQLDSVEGIGQKLKQAIINNGFNGTLKSLHYLQGRVYGVGDLKQFAISNWARRLEADFPKLLAGEFPNKSKIIQDFENQDRKLNKQLEPIAKELNSLIELKTIAQSNMDQLNKTKPHHFVSAYKEDKQASQQVSEYIKGAFPEWAVVPSWFKTLISEYGPEDAKVA